MACGRRIMVCFATAMVQASSGQPLSYRLNPEMHNLAGGTSGRAHRASDSRSLSGWPPRQGELSGGVKVREGRKGTTEFPKLGPYCCFTAGTLTMPR